MADLIRLGLAVATGTCLSSIVALTVGGAPHATAAFFFLVLLFLGVLVVGSRSLYRILDYSSRRARQAGAPALIYGAGRSGQLVLRAMLTNETLGLRPIGFIDDEPALQGRDLNGFPILGSCQTIREILDTHHPGFLVVSTDVEHECLQRTLRACDERDVPVIQARLQFTTLSETSGAPVPLHLDDREWRPVPYERRRKSSRQVKSVRGT